MHQRMRFACAALLICLCCAGWASAQTLEIKDYLSTPITGSLDGKGTNEILLSRINALREEVGGSNRFFANDINGPLYIIDKATKKFTVYLDFSGIFHKLTITNGYGNGLNGFYLDPDTGEQVRDRSYKYVVAIPRARVDELRELLRRAYRQFQQKAIYLSVAGHVEFVTGESDAAE